VLEEAAVVSRQALEAVPRVRAGPPDLVEVELLHECEEPDHPHRVAFPRRVELLLLLEERCERLAHEEHAVLRLLGPNDDVGRAGQIERLMGPEAAGGAPAGLDLVQ
jgi:hypothetical protein